MKFQYRPEIDSLRALAVIPVILFHLGIQYFDGGYIGVDVFFVISGYLITSLIIIEKSSNNFKIKKFLERRLRRLLPALYLVMLVTIPFSYYLLTPSELKDFGQSILSVTSISSNILFWRESGYFATASELKPLLHTWSLAIEAQFYIIFAIFYVLTAKLKKRSILFIFFLLLLLSFVLAIWGSVNKPTANFYLLPTRGWEFLSGTFIAYYMMNTKQKESRIRDELLSMIGLLMIFFSIIFFDNETPFPSHYTILPVLGTVLVILFTKQNTYIHKILNSYKIVWVGLISYSAYLWHFPILALTKNSIDGDLSKNNIFILLIFTLILSYLSWKFVERPFRSKELLSTRKFYKIIISFSLIFILIGSFLNITNGGINFYSKQDQVVLKNFINPSSYVISRFSKHELKDFKVSNNKKILIIGDSFAEDLINAYYESGAEIQDISTYYMLARCGVLMVDPIKIEKDQAEDCNGLRNFFSKPKLLKLMAEADEIWLSSNWEEWTLKFIKESISNISEINPNIKLFGPKYFGPVREKDYIKYGIDYWSDQSLSQNYKLFIRRINNLKYIVDGTAAKYIDIQSAVCAEKPCYI